MSRSSRLRNSQPEKFSVWLLLIDLEGRACQLAVWSQFFRPCMHILGWSKSSKTIPSASPRKLRVFRGLPSKIPQTFKLFEGYPRNFLKLLCCSRPQSRNSRFSRIPSKKPQLGKFTYFSRILKKPWILELY